MIPTLISGDAPVNRRVCVLWDTYDSVVEGRIMQDAARLSARGKAPTFCFHGGTEVVATAAATRLLRRFGLTVLTEAIADDDSLTVLYYTHGNAQPDLPEDLLAHDVIVRDVAPELEPATMQKVDTGRRPPDYVEQGNDPYPRFRSRVPQGVPSTYALDSWMWNPPPPGPVAS